MSAPTYHNGSDGKAYITPTGGTATALDVTKWNAKFTGNNKDVSGAANGRNRIAGVTDGSGTLSLHYDSTNKPMDATATTGLDIRPGKLLVLELIPDGAASGGTNSFRLTAIVDDVNPSSEFDGTVDFEINWSLASGSSLKYPGDT